jgi:hypothetical protein
MPKEPFGDDRHGMPLALIFPDQHGPGLEPTVQLGSSLLAARQSIKKRDRSAIETAENFLLDSVRDHLPDDVLRQPLGRRTAKHQPPARTQRGDAEGPNAVNLGLDRGRLRSPRVH